MPTFQRKKKKKKQLRAALRSAVAEASSTVVALEDETGQWQRKEGEEEEDERKLPPVPPWTRQRQPLDFAALARRHPRLAPFLLNAAVGDAVDERNRKKRKTTTNSASNEKKGIRLDFSSHDACAAFVASLLREGCRVVGWSVPRGSLVPALGVRDEYLDYVSKLIESVELPKSTTSKSTTKPTSSSLSSRADGHLLSRQRPQSSPPRPRPRPRPRILDVGCGSNLVFCLLASSRRNWRSVGLDVAPAALERAASTLERNPQLLPLVELRRGPAGGSGGFDKVGILRHGFKTRKKREEEEEEEKGEGEEEEEEEEEREERNEDGASGEERGEIDEIDEIDEGEDEWFDATVCNPPFFSSAAERAATANPAASGAWGGTDAEVVCCSSASASASAAGGGGGGEAAFVAAMIREGLADGKRIGNKVGWFTVFLGKKATLRSMVSLLRGEREGGGQAWKDRGDEAAAAAVGDADADGDNESNNNFVIDEGNRPALRWRSLDEHGGRTTRWVLAWSWTQE